MEHYRYGDDTPLSDVRYVPVRGHLMPPETSIQYHRKNVSDRVSQNIDFSPGSYSFQTKFGGALAGYTPILVVFGVF